MTVGRLLSTIGFCLGLSLALLPGSGHAADEDARERAVLRDFNAAAALQNAGLYDRAGEKWAAFISQNPADTRLDRAYYYLGISQLHSKKYAAAIATFQTLSSKYPAFPNGEGVQYSLGMARYQAALESKKREDFKSAAETLAAAAAKYPQGKHTAAALYYQGESLLAAGDPAAAMEAYKRLIANSPTSPLVADAYYALGTTQQEAGRDSEAIETFRKFLGTNGAGQPRVGHGSAAAAGAVALEAEEIHGGGAALCRGCGRGRFPQRRPRPACVKASAASKPARRPKRPRCWPSWPRGFPTAPTNRRRNWRPASATSPPANSPRRSRSSSRWPSPPGGSRPKRPSGWHGPCSNWPSRRTP